MSLKKARSHLARAKKQLEKVQVASWDSEDAEDAVNWAFYAYENAVVAAAEAAGMKWERTHPSKVAVAKELAEAGNLKTNVGERVAELNELRKDVQYGNPGTELRELNLEDLSTELEKFVEEVADFVDSRGN